MGPPRLIVRNPARHDLTVVLERELEIGRETDGLLVADTKMSRRHASFVPMSATTVKVTDLGSSNGTFVRDTAIGGPVLLGGGDRVRMGDTTVEVVAGNDDPAGGAGRSTQIVHAAVRATSIDLVAEAVASGGIDAELIGVGHDPGTLTVVFSDIESSTERAIEVGDVRWLEVLRHHTDLVAAHVRAHRGRIIKNQGDGFMMCFSSARQALLCSIGLQRDLDRIALARPDLALRVRMGMHTGEVLVGDDGDLFGRHVIVAARVGAAADGGHILVSSLVRQIAEPRGDVVFGPGVEMELKGLDGVTTVHEVDWRTSPVS